MADPVLVFAPSPQLTVTIDNRGGEPEIHLHPGGQGVWQARMVASLGTPVVLCTTLGGEVGRVLRHLIPDEDVRLRAVDVTARNGAYVHDRRNGTRSPVAEAPGEVLSRHELDALFELTLLEGLDARVAVLSGAADPRIVPVDTYRRLAADLGAHGCRVVADLADERLDEALAGGLAFVKISQEELVRQGRTAGAGLAGLVAAMHELRAAGAESVVISRAEQPALALLDGVLYEVRVPTLTPVDIRGAGDSMTAGVSAYLAQGATVPDAVRAGAAAGALNVTRHGLATSGGESIRAFAAQVELSRIDETGRSDGTE